MRATNRKRALMVSGSVILLCLSLIVGTTYALFTDTNVMKQHLKAGNLEMKLERTALTKTYLDTTGRMVTVAYTPTEAEADFTAATTENVFDIRGDEVIVPTSEYTAKLRVTNDEQTSDVMIGYWVEVTNGQLSAELSEQIKVSVNGSTPKSIKEGTSVGTEAAPIAKLGFGESDEFTVTILFDDMSDEAVDKNYEAMGDSIDFDVIVHAFQWVEEAPALQ